MKLISAAEIRSWDQYTIIHEPIASIDLMERAARACADYILKHFKHDRFEIICGNGNNGGDGLAIARMLLEEKQPIKVYINSEAGSEDYDINLKRYQKINPVYTWDDFQPEASAIIIDAIFGTGINRAPEGKAATLIQKINSANRKVIAIDMPSGLPSDFGEAPAWPVLKANITLTFQVPKPALLLPDSGVFAGKFEVLDIGLHPGYISQIPEIYTYSDSKYIKSLIKSRPEFSHKGTFGHALLYAGSENYCGAMILCATGILRSGAGLLTVLTDSPCKTALNIRLPEAMTTDSDEFEKYNVFAAGPGLGKDVKHIETIMSWIRSQMPMILDADALNLFSEQGFPELHSNVLLTPHPGEMRRLLGATDNSLNALWKQTALFAREHQCYILLKGKYSCLCSPDGTALFNSSGNSGLAKGGSGDMLTGIITGLVAQGYNIKDAATVGMWLHGKCAELAVSESAAHYILPEDLPDFLGKAWYELLHI